MSISEIKSVKLAQRSTLDIQQDIRFSNWKNANVELECRAGKTFSTTLKKMRMSTCNVELAQHSAQH